MRTRKNLLLLTLALALPLVAACSGGGGSEGETAGDDDDDGTATATATPGVTLNSITTSPLNVSVDVGATVQFAAVGHFSDGSESDMTDDVTWASSATSVADFDTGGVASALSDGTTSITATSGEGDIVSSENVLWVDFVR